MSLVAAFTVAFAIELALSTRLIRACQQSFVSIFKSSIMNRFEAIWFQQYFSEAPAYQWQDLDIFVNDALTEQDRLMVLSYPASSANDEFSIQNNPTRTRVILTNCYLRTLFGNLPSMPQHLCAQVFRELLKEHRIDLHEPDRIYYANEPAILPPAKENWTMRLLTKGDKLLFENFCHNIDDAEIDNAWVELEHWAVFGLFVDGTLASACSLYPWDDTKIADIGVLTHPTRRGQGLAKHLVNFAHHQIAKQGYVLQYRTQTDNKASIGLAQSLSLLLYALWEPLSLEA